MSTRKTIGGALGAIIVLLVAQILAQLVASLFVLVKIPVATTLMLFFFNSFNIKRTSFVFDTLILK